MAEEERRRAAAQWADLLAERDSQRVIIESLYSHNTGPWIGYQRVKKVCRSSSSLIEIAASLLHFGKRCLIVSALS